METQKTGLKIETNEKNTTALSTTIGSGITNAISQDVPANKEQLAIRVATIQNKSNNVLSRLLMSSGDKKLMKTVNRAEVNMLETVTKSDYNLLNTHCDALLNISQNFHKALTEALKGSFDLSKGNSLMSNKHRLLTIIDEKTNEFLEIYKRHQKRIETAGNDAGLVSFLEKILMKSMNSFMTNQEYVLSEFDKNFD